MLPLNRHKIAIPNSLAAIAAACCLALAWAGYDAGMPGEAHAEVPVMTAHAETAAQPADPDGEQDQEREQHTESAHSRQLPDFTFFLFPGRRAR